MQKQIIKANSRGSANYQWLQAKYSFSFAGYQNPERIHFGALRVLNDDIIQAGTGFGEHPHDNMEIITIPLRGAISHKDSMEHEEVIGVNEVQVMSAGTGIFHSENNASQTEDINLLQIWIFPNENNVKPVYDQKYFDPAQAQNQWQKLVTSIKNKDGKALTIHQNAHISRSFLSKDTEIEYEIEESSYGVYLFIIDGEVEIEGDRLEARDAIALTDTNSVKIEIKEAAHVLCIEVPDIK